MYMPESMRSAPDTAHRRKAAPDLPDEEDTQPHDPAAFHAQEVIARAGIYMAENSAAEQGEAREVHPFCRWAVRHAWALAAAFCTLFWAGAAVLALTVFIP